MLTRDFSAPAVAEGDGVLLVGGGRYWPGIVVSVKMLRTTGSQLPIEIWHRGAEEPVEPADLADVEGVRIIDAVAHRQAFPTRILRGWESKAYALQHCQFSRVLYLDADAYCVADPAPLFELLAEAPLIFWQDLPKMEGQVQWQKLGVVNPGVPAIQGGQLLFDRRAAWRELCIAHWCNQHSDFYYQHMYGDQDVWRLTWAATGQKYRNLGRALWQRPAFVCSHGGKPFIVHRCQGKMFEAQPGQPNNALPGEAQVWEVFRSVFRGRNVGKSTAEVFEEIYRRGLWGHGSGGGSDPKKSLPYLRLVEALIEMLGIRRVVDVGSGDGRIIGELIRRCPGVHFAGTDCCSEQIAMLAAAHPGHDWTVALGGVESLPAGDLLLCKDTLHHWPAADVEQFLTAVRSSGKWRWAIFTQDVHQQGDAHDTYLGGYRPLHPEQYPLKQFGLRVLLEYDGKAALLMNCAVENVTATRPGPELIHASAVA